MRKGLIFLLVMSAFGVCYGSDTYCVLSQDTAGYYDISNYHNMYYLQSVNPSAWSARMATDILDWKAKSLSAGTRVRLLEQGGDVVVVRLGVNTYYIMPDVIDCPD